MDLMIGPHHLVEVLAVVHVEQGRDVGVAVADMAEDCHRHMLPLKEGFQVADQLADPCGGHDHVVHEVDRLLARIEPVERGIQGLSGFPELVALLLVVGDGEIAAQLIASADGSHLIGPFAQVALAFAAVEFSQQRGGRIGGNAMRRPPDQVQRVRIHDFQRARPEAQQMRHRFPHFFKAAKVNQRRQRTLWFRHETKRRFAHHAQRTLTADEQFREIKDTATQAVDEAKQVIPATILAHRRLLAVDQAALPLDEVEDRLERRMGREGLIQSRIVEVHRGSGEPGAGRQADTHGLDVILDGAVDQGVGPGRIVGEHAPELAHVSAGRVGTEEKIASPELLVQFSQDDPRLHAGPAFLLIHFEDTIHLGDIQDDAGADRRAGQIGAGRARREGDAPLHRKSHDGIDVAFMLREHDGLRLHPVNAGIDGVGGQRGHVVPDLRLSEELPKAADDDG